MEQKEGWLEAAQLNRLMGAGNITGVEMRVGKRDAEGPTRLRWGGGGAGRRSGRKLKDLVLSYTEAGTEKSTPSPQGSLKQKWVPSKAKVLRTQALDLH